MVGDQHVNALPRREAGGNALHDGRDAASQQRRDHNGQVGCRRHVAVSAGCATHHAIGAGDDIDVKVDVDFQGAEDHHVELVAACRLAAGVGVDVGGDLHVVRVARQRGRCLAVKALGVEQLFDEPLLVQIHQAAGDAAKGEARLHAAALHLLFHKTGAGGGRCAGAGLHREAWFEIARVFNHVRRIAGDHQLERVAGDARRADALHLHDVVHLILHQAGGHIGEWHQRFGQQHHLTGKVRIHHGVAQRTAARFSVRPVGVAKLIAARHAEKRHVDIQLAVLEQLHAPAVGVNLHRLVHQPVGDGIRQPAAHAGGVNPGDDATLDMLDQRVIAGHQRAGSQGQIFEAHPRQQRHDGVDHPVAFAKGMVEGDGHPVLQAAALNRLFN